MRFWQLLSAMILLSTHVAGVLAQQDQSVLKHCLDASSQPVPLAEIDITGILFLSDHEGIRAIRSAVSTTYVIAFSDHHSSFATSGSLSPDGKWFAYPTGTSEQANSTDRNYEFEHIHFVDTHTGDHVFSVPVEDYALFESGAYPVAPLTASLAT